QIGCRFDFFDQGAQHPSVKVFDRADVHHTEFSAGRRPALFRHAMSAGHGVNHVTVGMRTEHLLHAIAGAKSQIARGVKVTKALPQNALRPLVTIMTFHDWEPIKKESCQRQAVSLRRFSSDMTQPTFCKSKDDVGLKSLHRRLQRVISCQRPDQILVVGDPWGQPRTEPALSQAIHEIRQSQRCMYEKAVIKVGVAGNVQFKWITLDELPVHDDAHTAIIFGRHNAYKQNATCCCHRELPELSCFWTKITLVTKLSILQFIRQSPIAVPQG